LVAGIAHEFNNPLTAVMGYAAGQRALSADRERGRVRMSVIVEASRETPVIAEADVVVCGGGPGGAPAAIAAALPPIILDEISTDLVLACDPETGNDLLARYARCLIFRPIYGIM